MDRVEITTAHNVGIELQAAGIGDRAAAALIDYGLLIAYLMTTFILAEGFTLIDESLASKSLFIVLMLPYLLYFPLSEIFLSGQSIGKKIRRIKVARLDGTSPSLGDYAIRSLFRLVEIDITMGLVAVLTLLIRGHGQRLGDLAARTTVIKLLPAVTLQDTLFSEIDDAYQPVYAETVNLSEKDIVLAKEVLESFRKQTRKNRRPAGTTPADKIKEALEGKMGIASPLPPLEFLETILRDYNFQKRR